jgi:mannose-6-phosphate isomerase-like protein (cupin superfamily)
VSGGHLFRRAAEASYSVPEELAGRSEGFRVWPVVGEDIGAVHTGFDICELDAGGKVAAHVNSFEQSFFVLEGEAVLDTSGGSTLFREGDYGLVPVGVPHSWRGAGKGSARWANMAAPAPRHRFDGDTMFVPSLPSQEPTPVDVRDPRTRSSGHIDPPNMDASRQSQDMLAVSASMRTALLVYSGITVKMMVDSDLGAQLSTMFMVQYEPEGVAGAHDHPLEETYLILEGHVDAVFDGEECRLGPGDVGWAGVGSVHQFSNPGPGPVRWLETQAPQPPARHSYRFARDWTYLRETLSSTGREHG